MSSERPRPPSGPRPTAGPRPSQRLPRSVYVRRRIMVGVIGLAFVGLLGLGTARIFSGGEEASGSNVDSSVRPQKRSRTTTSTTTSLPTTEVPAPALTPDAPQGAEGTAGETALVRVQTLGGSTMSPKSIVASPKGLLFAQNMMYHHTISVFRPDGALLKTIPDAVNLADYGIQGHPGISKGAPVEMAFSPDGDTAWVSNYSMYGSGFGPEGQDKCSPGDGTDKSFVYRIDTKTLKVTAVVPVGAVPKFVATTPDGSKVLVSNWCTWDLTIIDTATNTVSVTVELNGRYPRGIAVSGDSTTAYVAMMGSDRVVKVDLATRAVTRFASTGGGPRHIVISPDDKWLYVSNNRSGTVSKVSRATGSVESSASTGSQPRSLAISADGEALYVVNYDSATMTKVRASDMSKLQTVKTDHHPIGITYEPTLRRVWVANYGGRVIVFDDSRKPANEGSAVTTPSSVLNRTDG